MELSDTRLWPPSIIEQDIKDLSRLMIHATNAQPVGPQTPQYAVIMHSDILDQAYAISQEMALRLISKDKYGCLLKINQDGNHAVVAKDGVHFKANGMPPLTPGMESAMYCITKLLVGQGATPSALVSLQNVTILQPKPDTPTNAEYCLALATKTLDTFLEKNPTFAQDYLTPVPHSYVLQASRTVEGISLQDFIQGVGQKKYSYDQVDKANFSALFLSSLLTNPADAKGDNFRVYFQKQKAFIIGIDNDEALVPELGPITSGAHTSQHNMNVRNILYFLPLMNHVVEKEIYKNFIAQAPESIVLQWLGLLDAKNERYGTLKLSKDLSDDLRIPLKLKSGTTTELLSKIHLVQATLKDHPEFTHTQLLQTIQPITFAYYQKLKKLYPDPLKGFAHLYAAMDGKTWTVPKPVEDFLDVSHKIGPSAKPLFKLLRELELKKVDNVQTIRELTHNLLSNLSPTPGLVEQLTRSFAERAHLTLIPDRWRQPEVLQQIVREDLSAAALKLLIKLGANPHWVDKVHQPLLHKIINQHKDDPQQVIQRLEVLLEQPGIIETLDSNRQSALDLALRLKASEIVSYLIYKGAGKHVHWRHLQDFQESVKLSAKSPLATALKILESRNPEIAWRMALETLLPSKGNGTAIKTATQKTRFLRPDVFQQLTGPKGEFKALKTYGRAPVGRATHGDYELYFKLNPELPGMEYAAGELMRLLAGHGAPYVELTRMGEDPVLISGGIKGDNLQDVLEKKPISLAQLDLNSLGKILLSTMIIRPEDGKPDNYILTPFVPDSHPTTTRYTITCVDNDHSFVPTFATEVKDGNTKLKVRVKSVLFCLDQMKEKIPQEVRDHFRTTLNPGELTTKWLQKVSGIHESYMGLFTPDELKVFLSRKHNPTFIGVPFTPLMIQQLYADLIRLQKILEDNQNNPDLTFIDLLMKLEPELGKRYQAILAENISVAERFKRVDGGDYKTNAQGGYITSTTAQAVLRSQKVEPNEMTLDQLKRGVGIGPHTALIELQKIQEQLRKEILGQSLEDFQSLTMQAQREKFLAHNLDLRKLPLSSQQQWLEELKRYEWRSLSLNTHALTNMILQKFTLANLTHLQLSQCPEVTGQIFVMLSETSPGLSSISLHDLPGLTEIIYVAPDVRAWLSSWIQSTSLRMKNLTHLTISSCDNLERLGLDTPRLRKLALPHCPKLSTLALQCPLLRSADFQGDKNLPETELATLIAQAPTLTDLKLQGCDRIEEREMLEKYPRFNLNLFKKLSAMTQDKLRRELIDVSLTELNLAQNQIDDQGAQFFADILQRNAALTQLNLTWNQIGASGAASMAQALLTNSALRQLDLSINQIGDKGAASMAQALLTNSALRQLDLEDNQMGASGAASIAQALLTNSALRQLNLGSNYIGAKGAASIAQALLTNSALRQLNLGHNEIGDQGAASIAQALLTNAALTRLDLGQNQIGASGAASMAQALLTNSALRQLNLGSNQMGDQGAASMAQALLSNSALTDLNLVGNQIGDSGAASMAQALLSNSALTWLDLSHNQIGEKLRHEISEAVERNRSRQASSGRQLLQTQIPSMASPKAEKPVSPLLIPLSTASLPTVSLPLKGKLSPQGHTLIFEEAKMSEFDTVHNAASCGFNVLGLDRDTAVEKLLESQNQPEIAKEIRQLIQSEIKAALVTGTLPPTLKDSGGQALAQQYHKAQSDMDETLRKINTSLKTSVFHEAAALLKLFDTMADAFYTSEKAALLKAIKICDDIERTLNTYGLDPDIFTEFVLGYLAKGGWLSYIPGSTASLDALAKLTNTKAHVWQKKPGSSQEVICVHTANPSATGNTVYALHTHGLTHYNLLILKEESPGMERAENNGKQEVSHGNELSSITAIPERISQTTFLDEGSPFWTKPLANPTEGYVSDTRHAFPKDTPNHYYGLSICGGGIRGLIPAVILEALETRSKDYTKKAFQIHELFDYLGGTSIGGILALGCTASADGHTRQIADLAELTKLFTEHGHKIFTPKTMGILENKYSADGLEALLSHSFQDLHLSDTLTNVLVTTVDGSTSPFTPFIFDSWNAQRHAHWDFLMRDVGRATSAAPTYFSSAQIYNLRRTRPTYSHHEIMNWKPAEKPYTFLDGGIWKNNPAELVLEAIKRRHEDILPYEQNVHILSLGTGQGTSDYRAVNPEAGKLGWLLPLIFAQMDLSSNIDNAMHTKLGKRYLSLQPELRDERGIPFNGDLADAKPEYLQLYQDLAHKELKKHKTQLEEMLRQQVEYQAQKREFL
jgi:patatin-like phospholipase/acyl hydrolase/Ran GTPase-activating protein (RanGAP) involved in mRNA processing and transport